MKVSHTAMRKRIEDEKSKLPDQDLFGTPQFGAYLSDLADATTKRYKRRVRVQVGWDDSPGAELAYTDHRKIVINCGNRITQSLPTRALRVESIFGMLGHELGHVLYTDFKQSELYLQSLADGRIYPNLPSELDATDTLALEEWMKFVADKNKVAINVILEAAHFLNNILEDIYIEAQMCEAYPGLYRSGILLNSVRMADIVPSIQKQVDQGLEPYSIMINLIVQYCRRGDVNNLGDYQGEYLEDLDRCTKWVDSSIYGKPRDRLDAANHLVLKLWKYIKGLMDHAQEEMQRTGKSVDEVLGNVSEKLEQEIAMGAGAPSEETGPARGVKKSIPDLNELTLDRDKIQEVVAEEGGRIALVKTEDIEEGDEGGIERNNFYSGTGYSHAASDVCRLLTSMAEERVSHQMEEELSDELQKEADKVRLGNAHRGMKLIVNRMVDLPDGLDEQYQIIAPPLLHISKRLQRQVAQYLMDEQTGGKLVGQFMSRRLETHSLYREDGRIFYSRKLPKEEMNLVVALLVDESGSMSCGDRATTARATSIVLYDFCRALDIPILIYGHSAEDANTVDLYAYSEFDSVDNQDRIRMMDISSRSENRDGAALRYIAERLVQRPEEKKLLIILSDGQPSAPGYTGTEAEADLRGIKKEFTNKGIQFLAAAIGEDKPNIQRIYGDAFLDVTDLSRLPVNLTKLLIRQLRY